METPFGNSLAAQIYTGGVVPLEDSEKEGYSLAERGLKEEQKIIATRVPEEPVKRKRGRPPKNAAQKLEQLQKNEAKKAAPFTPESIDEVLEKMRPPKDPVSGKKLKPTEFQSAIDTEFLKEICQFQKQLFRIVETLSTGNWKLVSQTHGGIDLEYGYRLQKRLQDEGLI